MPRKRISWGLYLDVASKKKLGRTKITNVVILPDSLKQTVVGSREHLGEGEICAHRSEEGGQAGSWTLCVYYWVVTEECPGGQVVPRISLRDLCVSPSG